MNDRDIEDTREEEDWDAWMNMREMKEQDALEKGDIEHDEQMCEED